jgi:uncharacterized membrane protein HdeD (DUF308 family)
MKFINLRVGSFFMSTVLPGSGIAPSPLTILTGEVAHLRRHWGWFLALGIAMVILGTIAIGWACLTTITIAATWVFGVVLLAGGFAEVVGAFSARKWSGMLVHLLVGVLYAVTGFMIVDAPGESAILLTRIIAIFLIVGGIFRMLSAIIHRYVGRGWIFFNGIITFLLGVMIYKGWPESGLWFIGLYLGIDMILNGWTWIMLSLGLRGASPMADVGTAR